MKIAVRYYSRSGNTKRVADAIATAAGTAAETIDRPVGGQVELLFVGSGLYAGKIDKALRGFLQGLEPSKVKRVAVFSTSMSGTSAHAEIKKILDERGIAVANEFFHCPGKFLLFNGKHPNDKDLEAAAKFARSFAASVKKKK
ncbi:MAG: flavodoxin [Clostridiales bacterium]|jgi:flavodoxin|nr:flavodoxin [Clostridiales bacterium]